MAMKLAETQLWQYNLAALIRSGLYVRAEMVPVKGLFGVVGVYTDGSHSAIVAKYGSESRAEDAATIVNQLALKESVSPEDN